MDGNEAALLILGIMFGVIIVLAFVSEFYFGKWCTRLCERYEYI
jgi:hypothetical protein